MIDYTSVLNKVEEYEAFCCVQVLVSSIVAMKLSSNEDSYDLQYFHVQVTLFGHIMICLIQFVCRRLFRLLNMPITTLPMLLRGLQWQVDSMAHLLQFLR